MFVVVGLGNPGEEYAHTRHSVGFMTVDELARRVGARYWKNEHGSLTAKVQVGGEDVVLAKPQSFMNVSGGPVKQVAKAYKVDGKHLIIVHDEVDLAPGEVRVKFGGGLNAHNGLRSIAAKTGTHDWLRVRCGIGRPPGRMKVADYVLQPLRKQQLDEFLATADTAADAVEALISEGFDKAERRFNR